MDPPLPVWRLGILHCAVLTITAMACAPAGPSLVLAVDAPRSAEEIRDLVRKGEEIHQRMGCERCHALRGGESPGPVYHEIFGEPVELIDGRIVVRDSAYLYRSIVDAQAEVPTGYKANMPSYANLDDTELLPLILFIKSFTSETREWEASRGRPDA